VSNPLISVVIADDEPLMRRVVKSALDEIDCNVVGEAEDGPDALEVVNKHNPDLILLDIQMPNQNGIKTLKQIIADKPDAYVVMLTSVDDSQTISECILAGAKDYLRKTIPIQDMMERLLTHIEVIQKGRKQA